MPAAFGQQWPNVCTWAITSCRNCFSLSAAILKSMLSRFDFISWICSSVIDKPNVCGTHKITSDVTIIWVGVTSRKKLVHVSIYALSPNSLTKIWDKLKGHGEEGTTFLILVNHIVTKLQYIQQGHPYLCSIAPLTTSHILVSGLKCHFFREISFLTLLCFSSP